MRIWRKYCRALLTVDWVTLDDHWVWFGIIECLFLIKVPLGYAFVHKWLIDVHIINNKYYTNISQKWIKREQRVRKKIQQIKKICEYGCCLLICMHVCLSVCSNINFSRNRLTSTPPPHIHNYINGWLWIQTDKITTLTFWHAWVLK